MHLDVPVPAVFLCHVYYAPMSLSVAKAGIKTTVGLTYHLPVLQRNAASQVHALYDFQSLKH